MAGQAPSLFLIAQPSTAVTAADLTRALGGHGISCWTGSLAPDGHLAVEAMARLRSASAVLLLFDRAAAASRDVDRHLLVARQEGKLLIPVRLEAVDEGLLRQELLDASWIDGMSPAAPSEIAARVYRAAATVDSEFRADAASAASPSPPVTSTGHKLLVWLCAFALLGILAVLIFLAVRPTSGPDVGRARSDASLDATNSGSGSGPIDGSEKIVPGNSPASPNATDRGQQHNPPGVVRDNRPLDYDDPEVTPVRSYEFEPLDTVERFYQALGRGDGTTAASLVVASKRSAGPLSGPQLTRYYSQMQRPLRLRTARLAGESTVLAEYDYVLRGGRSCRGTAAIDLVEADDGSALINGIRTSGPC